MALDWSLIGGAVMAAVTGGLGWWSGRAKREAAAEKASAEEDLYKVLRAELSAMRADVEVLRRDLDVERAHSRRQDVHISTLVRLLREKGIEPPPFTLPS